MFILLDHKKCDMEFEMSILNKLAKGLGAVIVLSLIGTIAAFAKTEASSISYQDTTHLAVYLAPDTNGNPLVSISPDNTRSEVCSLGNTCAPAWTGRWVITYLREGDEHWVTWCQLYVPDFIDNESDARKWRWSDEYIAKNCSQPNEPQTWEGIYLYVQKETFLKCTPTPPPPPPPPLEAAV